MKRLLSLKNICVAYGFLTVFNTNILNSNVKAMSGWSLVQIISLDCTMIKKNPHYLDEIFLLLTKSNAVFKDLEEFSKKMNKEIFQENATEVQNKDLLEKQNQEIFLSKEEEVIFNENKAIFANLKKPLKLLHRFKFWLNPLAKYSLGGEEEYQRSILNEFFNSYQRNAEFFVDEEIKSIAQLKEFAYEIKTLYENVFVNLTEETLEDFIKHEKNICDKELLNRLIDEHNNIKKERLERGEAARKACIERRELEQRELEEKLHKSKKDKKKKPADE